MNRVEKGMPYVAGVFCGAALIFPLFILGWRYIVMWVFMALAMALFAGTAWVAGWVKERFE